MPTEPEMPRQPSVRGREEPGAPWPATPEIPDERPASRPAIPQLPDPATAPAPAPAPAPEMIALASIPGPRAENALRQARHDSDERVRAQVKWALSMRPYVDQGNVSRGEDGDQSAEG